MSAERIATVVPVAEEDAKGKVADIFADIKKTKNITSWRPTPTTLLSFGQRSKR
jgi:hypothetical protein